MSGTPTGCCPPFDPAPWRDAAFTWKDRPFVKDHVTSAFHVPLNLGAKVTRNMALIEAAGAAPDQQLMLCDESSPWGSELYIAVTHDVPGAKMATMSGAFRTRVYDGPYSEVGRWTKDMQDWLTTQGVQADHMYYAYTTCPRCAKAYGHNYVVVFARVSPEMALTDA